MQKIFALALMTSSFASHAEFTRLDFLTQGDGLVKVDSRTGQEWLDPSYTRRMGRENTQARLTDDPNLSGFRLATADEAKYMFSYFHNDHVQRIASMNGDFGLDEDYLYRYTNGNFSTRYDFSIYNEGSLNYDYEFAYNEEVNKTLDNYFSVFDAYSPESAGYYDGTTSSAKRITRSSFGAVIDFNAPSENAISQYEILSFGYSEENNQVINGISQYVDDGIFRYNAQWGNLTNYYDLTNDNTPVLNYVDTGLYLVKGDFVISEVSTPAMSLMGLLLTGFAFSRKKNITR